MVFSWAWAGSMVIPTITAAHSVAHNFFMVSSSCLLLFFFEDSLKTTNSLVFALARLKDHPSRPARNSCNRITELMPSHAIGSGGSLLGAG
jgi:hypothetical protein